MSSKELDRLAVVHEAALAEPSATYRTVAQRFQVTREEVCQYMVVLRRLPADLRAMVEQERDPARLRTLSLRQLLRIARLPSAGARRSAFACRLQPHDDHRHSGHARRGGDGVPRLSRARPHLKARRLTRT